MIYILQNFFRGYDSLSSNETRNGLLFHLNSHVGLFALISPIMASNLKVKVSESSKNPNGVLAVILHHETWKSDRRENRLHFPPLQLYRIRCDMMSWNAMSSHALCCAVMPLDWMWCDMIWCDLIRCDWWQTEDIVPNLQLVVQELEVKFSK